MEMMAGLHEGALRKWVTSSLALPRFRGNCILFFSCSKAIIISEDHIGRYIHRKKKIYMLLLRATEIAFSDQTDDQSSLSFPWSIEVVLRHCYGLERKNPLC